MRLEQLGCGSHHRWQSDRPLRKFDLLARKELELDRLGIAREFEANLVRLSKNARQPRVRILHVKDRVLGGLLAWSRSKSSWLSDFRNKKKNRTTSAPTSSINSSSVT